MSDSIDRTRDRRPISLQVRDGLEELIASDNLRPGARLPSEGELAQRFGVARGSVREALKQLEQEGVVEVRHGLGRFVSPIGSLAIKRTAATSDSVSEILAELGVTDAATHSLTLDRGLRALTILRHHPEGLSVTELAQELGTHRAGVYRLLGPLTDHRVVRRLEDGRCILGSGLIDLAQGVQPRLIEAAAPVLRALAASVSATTALTLRDGEEAVVGLVVTPPDQPLHVIYRVGLRHPLTVGAPGHALLAATKPTAGEPTDVVQARDRGWALSSGQLLPGATGVAAAIPNRTGAVEAAISAVWIVDRDPDPVAREVIAAAGRIAAEAGLD